MEIPQFSHDPWPIGSRRHQHAREHVSHHRVTPCCIMPAPSRPPGRPGEGWLPGFDHRRARWPPTLANAGTALAGGHVIDRRALALGALALGRRPPLTAD